MLLSSTDLTNFQLAPNPHSADALLVLNSNHFRRLHVSHTAKCRKRWKIQMAVEGNPPLSAMSTIFLQCYWKILNQQELSCFRFLFWKRSLFFWGFISAAFGPSGYP